MLFVAKCRRCAARDEGRPAKQSRVPKCRPLSSKQLKRPGTQIWGKDSPSYSYWTKVWTDFALNRENQSTRFSTHNPYNTHYGSTHTPCTSRFKQNKEQRALSISTGFNSNLGYN